MKARMKAVFKRIGLWFCSKGIHAHTCEWGSDHKGNSGMYLVCSRCGRIDNI